MTGRSFFLPVKDFFHKLLTRFSLSRKAETPDAIRQRGAIFQFLKVNKTVYGLV
jgi:hypothetical protein